MNLACVRLHGAHLFNSGNNQLLPTTSVVRVEGKGTLVDLEGAPWPGPPGFPLPLPLPLPDIIRRAAGFRLVKQQSLVPIENPQLS